MAAASIPVDLTNPGQVFACLGFLEAACELLGEARGGFDWRHSDDACFRLAVPGTDDPIAYTLRFLDGAEVKSRAPAGSRNSTAKWNVETVTADSHVFPFPDPGSPATLPASLEDADGRRLVIDHWGDATRRDNVKFWAGAGGYPGAALARDALDLIRGRVMDFAHDPFALTAEQSSSFRFDWRRDYIPLDVGFSPNAHGDVTMQGYPVVELMAAVGLAYARPFRRNNLEYSYGVAGALACDLFDPAFLRVALGSRQAPFPGLPFRLFAIRLGWPGQEGQARCITNVTEEFPRP